MRGKLRVAVLSGTCAALVLSGPLVGGAYANAWEELVSWWQFLTISGFWH